MEYRNHFIEVLDQQLQWEQRWPDYETHPAQMIAPERLASAWDAYSKRLALLPPFFHPSYAGQMQKPPHPVAALGYFAAMLMNPNNYSKEGGAATLEMEAEAIAQLTRMFHLPASAWGHLTSSGTLANLEALWVSRELHPKRGIAYSEDSHPIHARACSLLGISGYRIPVDDKGRIDLQALEDALQSGRIGTVVLTAGTTGLGAIDPIDEVLLLRHKYDFRIHVDAAYGGFFTLLAWEGNPHYPSLLPLRAIAACDSVAVDPHKHGLQPYGCGCILYRDTGSKSVLAHDSPYTCMQQGNAGALGLECSRPGAAAGALWFTLQCLPLSADEGMGSILRACLDAGSQWASQIERSQDFCLFVPPDLDIVTFLPRRPAPGCATLDAACATLAREAALAAPPVFFSLLQVDSRRLAGCHPEMSVDRESCRVLRSVLMKPEQITVTKAWLEVLNEVWEKQCRASFDSACQEQAANVARSLDAA